VRSTTRALTTLAIVLVLAGCGGGSTSSTSSSTVTRGTTPSPRPPLGHVVAAILDASGWLVTTLTGDGPIATAVADGKGGWFLAGSFAQLDGTPEHGLAHVLATGAVDPKWSGTLTSSGQTALAASATELYAAGSIADTDRSTLVALDAATGRPGAPLRASPPGPISALALIGDRLLVATSTITDPRRPSCLEAADPHTGKPDPGYGALVPVAPELGCVQALVPDGAQLYLAGHFQSVAGAPRAGLARIDGGTGTLDTSWRPRSQPCPSCPGLVYDVAIGGGHVFAATARPGVLALSLTTGAREPGWAAPAGVENALGLAAVAGRLFVSGDFTRAGGVAANGLAVLSASDGSLLRSWHPAAGESARVASASGARVLVGLHAR
jgi:hypothetical protein